MKRRNITLVMKQNVLFHDISILIPYFFSVFYSNCDKGMCFKYYNVFLLKVLYFKVANEKHFDDDTFALWYYFLFGHFFPCILIKMELKDVFYMYFK